MPGLNVNNHALDGMMILTHRLAPGYSADEGLLFFFFLLLFFLIRWEIEAIRLQRWGGGLPAGTDQLSLMITRVAGSHRHVHY